MRVNIGCGLGARVDLEGLSELPFPLSELVWLGLALQQPACPLNRQVAASTLGLLVSSRAGGVEFDNPPNHSLLNAVFFAANERTCWARHTH